LLLTLAADAPAPDRKPGKRTQNLFETGINQYVPQ
jgi:hypothetical protein